MSTSSDVPLVAHVIYRLGTGGLENGLINIINRTPEDRFRHAIICLTESESFAQRITREDVPIISLYKKEGLDAGHYRKLKSALSSLGPRIVHTRNLAALEAQMAAALIPGSKRVHGEHGRDVFDLHGTNTRYNLLRRFIKPLIHRYIAVSRDLADWLCETIRVRPEKVRQIYNGVDTQVFFPGPAKTPAYAPEGFLKGGAVIIGTVGRLAGVKDQSTLVRAAQALIEKRPDLRHRLRLLIVGDGPERARLQRLVKDTGLESLT